MVLRNVSERSQSKNWTVSSKIGLGLLGILVVGKYEKLESLKFESFAEVENTQV